MTAAVAAVAAATVGYTIGVLTSRNGNVPAPTPEKKMKPYKGAWVEVKDEGPSDFSIDSGDAKKGAKLFKAKCATCHSANAGGGAPPPQRWHLAGFWPLFAAYGSRPHASRQARSRARTYTGSWARRLRCAAAFN